MTRAMGGNVECRLYRFTSVVKRRFARHRRVSVISWFRGFRSDIGASRVIAICNQDDEIWDARNQDNHTLK